MYDKGVDVKGGEGLYELLVSYRSGDMWAPKVDQAEALATEAQYLVKCISSNERPFNDGWRVSGLSECSKPLTNP